MTDTEINQAFDHKVRKGIFNPVARYLTNLATAEDQLQDAICQTWMMYRRYADEKGVILDDALLVKKCRWVASDLDRRFVGKNGATCRNKDVYDPRCYRDGHVMVYRLDGIDAESGESDRALEIGLAEAMAASPERKLNSAMDLEEWVGELSHRDRGLMEMKMAGYPTSRVASELDQTYYSVRKRERELGFELAGRAGVWIDRGGEQGTYAEAGGVR